MGIKDARIIHLPKIEDERGNLSIIEQLQQIPFLIKRVHWIYDVPGGLDRGGHAYKETEEFIVALSGSFDVVIDDGIHQTTYPLNRSYFGLYVPKGMWRTMTNFSTNSLALVLSSTEYDENDYVSDYEEYKVWRQNPSRMPVKSDAKTSVRVTHAHKKCHQFLIAASGSSEVVLDDGVNKRTVQLNRPFWGLHIPSGIWASEQSFSSGSICLVLASEEYAEDDYIRNYDDYLDYLKSIEK